MKKLGSTLLVIAIILLGSCSSKSSDTVDGPSIAPYYPLYFD